MLRRGAVQALLLAVALAGISGPSSAGTDPSPDASPQVGPSPEVGPSPDPCVTDPEGEGCEAPPEIPDPAEGPEVSSAQTQSEADLCAQSGAITGTPGDDPLTGTPGDDIICGFDGNDTIDGMGGDDILFGGDGDDDLMGGDGSDFLEGGDGSDSLDGGDGPDTCRPVSSPTWDDCEAPRARDGKTSTPLDITLVTGPSNGSSPKWRFVTRKSWSLRKIWDDGFFLIFLDHRGGSGVDKVIIARAKRTGRGYIAHVYRLRSGKPELQKDRVAVARPNGRSIAIRVPFREIGLESGRNVYRWYAMSIFNGKGCGRGCLDTLQKGVMFPEIRP